MFRIQLVMMVTLFAHKQFIPDYINSKTITVNTFSLTNTRLYDVIIVVLLVETELDEL